MTAFQGVSFYRKFPGISLQNGVFKWPHVLRKDAKALISHGLADCWTFQAALDEATSLNRPCCLCGTQQVSKLGIFPILKTQNKRSRTAPPTLKTCIGLLPKSNGGAILTIHLLAIPLLAARQGDE